MATAHDVAAYILAKQEPMSTWKLQKLVYYCQAWHLVWDEERLFPERIEAWANGPVVRDLYVNHRGKFTVGSWAKGHTSNLTPNEQETIDVVLASYGSLSGRQLSYLTHSELPWREAREGLAPDARSTRAISLTTIQEYYGALDADEGLPSVAEIDWANLDAS